MLKNIRVIDFSQYLPGPHATLRLGDLGAEIIKIEPLTGDPTRDSDEKEEKKRALIFKTQNRNKKSIALNLKEENDLHIAKKLIVSADVVIESFRPGVMKRLGIDYEEALKLNPSIVYCSLTGYGQNGLYSKHGGHDLNFMALSGVISQLKDKAGSPIHPSMTFADLVAGIVTSESIISALLHRKETGESKYLDISIADVMISLMGNHVSIEQGLDYSYGEPSLNNQLVCYGLYETKDKRFVSLGALEHKFWVNFCEAINKQEWVNEGHSKSTDDNAVYQGLKKVFHSKTLIEWEAFSEEVDCCLTPVLEVEELYEHKYVRSRKLMNELNGMKQVAVFNSGLGKKLEESKPAPELNGHKEEILSVLKAYINN